MYQVPRCFTCCSNSYHVNNAYLCMQVSISICAGGGKNQVQEFICTVIVIIIISIVVIIIIIISIIIIIIIIIVLIISVITIVCRHW